jgi:sulfide dehydrogenase [flavocytochrome c] flavoprotein chain
MSFRLNLQEKLRGMPLWSTHRATVQLILKPCVLWCMRTFTSSDMPKSAFSANSQAKVTAMSVRAELTGSRAFPARYTNTCWSLVDTDNTVKVGGTYVAGEGKIKQVETFISKTGESADLRKQTQAENMGWYAGITADIFS